MATATALSDTRASIGSAETAIVDGQTQVSNIYRTSTETPPTPLDDGHDALSYKWQQEEGPDEGYGWFVVAGAFLGQFTSFGTTSSWGLIENWIGVMQNYYERYVFNNVPNAQLQLSLAGTLMELLVDLMGPVFQILSTRYGIKFVMVLGMILGVLGLELAGFTSQIWHLYLTQGILFGMGASFLYIVAMGVPPQWFHRRRGLALGIVSSGSGFGGLVLPFIVGALNDAVGIAWSYRILGFLVLGLNIVTCVLVKERHPRHKRKFDSNEKGAHQQPKLGEIFNFNVLKDTNYLLWVLGSVIALMGYFIPFFFMPSYCSYLGMSSDVGTTLVAAMSAGNFVGRIMAGVIGDRIGHLNANITFTLLSGISSLVIWTHAYTYGTLMAFSVVFGLFCCSYVTFLSPVTATILGMERFATGLSIIILSNCISVWGPTIASGVESRVNAEPYYSYKIFTGATYLVGGTLLFILKVKMSKAIFTKI